MVGVKLSEHDERLLSIYDGLVTAAEYWTSGNLWCVEVAGEERVEFNSYKEFIEFIESDVKTALLVYAYNKELGEIADI